MHDRHDGLAGLLDGHPLDGQRDDLAGPLVRFRLGLRLDVPDGQRGLALGLGLDGRQQLGLGLPGGKPGDTLQFVAVSCFGIREPGGPPVQLLLALVKGGDLVLDPSQLVIEALLALAEPRFPPLPQLADLVLDGADLRLDLAPVLRRPRRLPGLLRRSPLGLLSPLGRSSLR